MSDLRRRPRRLRKAGDLDIEQMGAVVMGGFFSLALLPGVLLTGPRDAGRIAGAVFLTVLCLGIYRSGRFGVHLSRRGIHVCRFMARNVFVPWDSVAEFRLERAKAKFHRFEAEHVVLDRADGQAILLPSLHRPIVDPSASASDGIGHVQHAALDPLIDHLNEMARARGEVDPGP